VLIASMRSLPDTKTKRICAGTNKGGLHPEKAGLHGMRYAPNDRRALSAMERRPAMKKISTVKG